MTKLLPPVSPGEILREEFMSPHGLGANRLAEHLGVPPNRISTILKGDRAITADTALRLANCFVTTPEFWMNLQVHYELKVAKRMSAKAIAKAVRPIGPMAA
jgi:addiction module HigA family antidote